MLEPERLTQGVTSGLRIPARRRRLPMAHPPGSHGVWPAGPVRPATGPGAYAPRRLAPVAGARPRHRHLGCAAAHDRARRGDPDVRVGRARERGDLRPGAVVDPGRSRRVRGVRDPSAASGPPARASWGYCRQAGLGRTRRLVLRRRGPHRGPRHIPFFARLTVARDSELDAALVLVRFLVALPIGASSAAGCCAGCPPPS